VPTPAARGADGRLHSVPMPVPRGADGRLHSVPMPAARGADADYACWWRRLRAMAARLDVALA